MRPIKRADLAAVDDAKQRRADGIKAGMTWNRRNPYGRCREGRGRFVDAAWGNLGLPMHRKPDAPRNAPCPCGGGKKFKHCCLNGGAK